MNRLFPFIIRRLSTQRPSMTAGERLLFEKLQVLTPKTLEVNDISGGCGSMYQVSIESLKFKGIPMVKQHRMVSEILKEEIKTMHGIQIKTSVPPS
jgi:stress-induced morphogen